MNKIYVGIICFLVVLCIVLKWQGCNKENELQQAIDGRAKVDSLFEKQGKELKQVQTVLGDTVQEAISLRLNNAQLELLAQDLKMQLKKAQPISIIVTQAAVNVDSSKTVFHDTLPCQPFDTTFNVHINYFNKVTRDSSLGLKYNIHLTNKSHTLSGLEVPFKITTVYNERHRFLRAPEVTVDTRIDNPFVKLTSTASAVRKEKPGFRIVNVFVPVGLGVLVGMYLMK